MLTFHWKAPLQPKGFLKIVELLVAILAFSLVAGFTATSRVECTEKISTSLEIKTKYPFFTHSETPVNGGVWLASTEVPFSQHIISGQFFVTWGVFTLLYCITAIVVYILFTANENLERVVDILIYLDLGFHFIWVLGWFIASIDWAVGFHAIGKLMDYTLNEWGRHYCDNGPFKLKSDTFVQASIADVFGFLSLFLWAANIYWIFIDTAWFIQWRARRAHQQF